MRKPWTPEDRARMSEVARKRESGLTARYLLPPMSREQKLQYRKLRNCGIDRATALSEVGVTNGSHAE